jgi:hypothetical protein
MEMSAPPMHRVLWTAGWDSTFRVADLVLTHRRTVQPWYVVDPERRSTRIELARIRELTDLMGGLDAQAPGRIMPLEVRRLADLPPQPHVAAAAERIGAIRPMGAQHSWLPLLAIAEGLDDLELGWEADFLHRFLPLDAFSRNAGDAPDDWFHLDEGSADPDRHILMGRFRYPLITVTKVQMQELARERGFAAVMERTWSCRWPTVLRRSCGQCVPCTEARIASMGHRVAPDTLLRRSAHRLHWSTVGRAEAVRANAGSVLRRLRGARS